MFRITGLILLVLTTFNVQSQNERALVRQGNSFYSKKDYLKAEILYKKALEKNNKMIEARFNLANSQYCQKNYPEAEKQYSNVLKLSRDNKLVFSTLYNLGNSYLNHYKSTRNEELLNKSIETYKKALKIKPGDKNSQYNLSYALKLRNQRSKKDNQKKQNTNNLNEKNAERMLNALQNRERLIQNQLQKQKAKNTSTNIDKDW